MLHIAICGKRDICNSLIKVEGYEMEITIWMLLRARVKKFLGIVSPTSYIHGYKYQYDYLKALKKEMEEKGTWTP